MQREPTTRDEIRLLAEQARLDLRPEYFDELVEAYALVETMLHKLRRNFEITNEPAHVFVAATFARKAGCP